MNLKGNNTILITGGGSGIGRGLAEAFHKLGNTVIIAGRRKSLLETVAAANPGMAIEELDVQDTAKLANFAKEIVAKYPALNVLINMAGIMKREDLTAAPDGSSNNSISNNSIIDATIATNLTAPLQLTSALIDHLRQQPKATVINVTSGLAFTPLASAPTYCATKAALHSWSVSLRYQLRQTSVEVLELAPPYVQTELGGERQASDPRAMPLDEYIAEVMEILSTQPEAKEILVKNVYSLRFAGDLNSEKYYEFFERMNLAFAGH